MDSKTVYKTSSDIFECRQCGDCCKGFGGTYITDQDISRIASFINVQPEKFITDYCDHSGSRLVLTIGKDGYCIFFHQEKQCTIHPVKPRMCRAWPFIKTILKNPENWNAMAGSCRGMKKDVPHPDLRQIVARELQKPDLTQKIILEKTDTRSDNYE